MPADSAIPGGRGGTNSSDSMQWADDHEQLPKPNLLWIFKLAVDSEWNVAETEKKWQRAHASSIKKERWCTRAAQYRKGTLSWTSEFLVEYSLAKSESHCCTGGRVRVSERFLAEWNEI